MANLLSQSTSPYLLQHAQNPVDWHSWNEDAWERAKKENKLVLVSIGYSACHWCHVMEREVFEREDAAEVMNANFISIKVDREERPDVDHVYMSALQLMTGQGGWPLNVFCLPDGRPVYGGTYFPLDRWLGILHNLAELQQSQPSQLETYASQLHEGVRQLNELQSGENEQIDARWIHQVVDHWKTYWDNERGGARKAPKFPMPTNTSFLLHYAALFKDDDTLQFVKLTLNEMERGGINDQVGGGFARYSVDAEWKVPHFEKMLYDNAQLVTLYSEAFRMWKDPAYLDVIQHTLRFIERELTSPEGLFYAALDADSEGVEGKYYIWSEEELRELLQDDFVLAAEYYRIGKEGLWEHGQSILLRREGDESFLLRTHLNPSEWVESKAGLREKMRKARDLRVRPGLDHKIITSWNALMIRGLGEAWKATGEQAYLDHAIRAADGLRKWLTIDGRLYRQFTSGKTHGAAFLDDYAFVIEAWLVLFECTGSPEWLEESYQYALHVLDHFGDVESGLCWFTSDEDEALFVRQKELADNVLPAANSSLCKSLFLLGHILDKPNLVEHSRKMLDHISPSIDFGASWSNWLIAYLWHTAPFHEVVACGPEAQHAQNEWNRDYVPNCLFSASTIARSLPLLRDRFRANTPLYVCTGFTCHAPVRNWSEAKELIL